MSIYTEKKNININKPKIRIMDIFMISLVRARELAETSVRTASRFVGYVIFISILVALMTFAVPGASKIVSFGGFSNLFRNVVPAFEVDDGVLTADKKFEMKLTNLKIVMDTDLDEYGFSDFETDGIYVAIGSKYIKMISITDIDEESTYNEIYRYPVAMIFPSGSSNETLVRLIPMVYIMMAFGFVVVAAISAVRYLLAALMYSLFSQSLMSVSKLPMTFGDSLHMCFYAETLGIILVNMNNAMGYPVSSFIMSAVGIFITIIIIHKAMGPHMPDIDDILNRFTGGDKDS